MKKLKKAASLILVAAIIGVAAYVTFINISASKPNDAVINLFYVNQFPEIEIHTDFIFREALSEIGKVEVTKSKNYDVVVDGIFGNKEIFISPHVVKLFYVGEAVPAKIEGYDLSMGFDDVEAPNYIRVPYYYLHLKEKINYASMKRTGKCDPKSKKKFACFLVSNSGEQRDFLNRNLDGCKARNHMFHLLSEYKHVNSGGYHLNNEGRVIPYDETEKWLSECKFVITYENSFFPNYVTEKAFSAYLAGAIPIYNAHPTYTKDINPDAVIYAGGFANEQAAVEYIKKVDEDDELYCKIWNNNILASPEQDYEKIKSKIKARLEEVFAQKNPKLLKISSKS
jgi:hypothetical protein